MHHHHAARLIAAGIVPLVTAVSAIDQPLEMPKPLFACIDCDFSQFEQRAQTMAGDWHLGDAVIHLGELRANRLEAHRLSCAVWAEAPPAPVVDLARPPAGPVKSRCARFESAPTIVDPAVAAKFAFWREWFLASDGTLRKSITVDLTELDGPWARVLREMKGFDIGRDLNAAARVAHDLASGCGRCPPEVPTFVREAEWTMIAPVPEIRATVRLVDGATVELALTSTTGRFEEVEGSLRMADGQPIPMQRKGAAVKGAWRFAPERAAEAEAFVDYLRSLWRVDVEMRTPGPIGEVVCVTVDGTDRSRCEVGAAGD